MCPLNFIKNLKVNTTLLNRIMMSYPEIMTLKFSKKELEQQLNTLQASFDEVQSERNQLAQEVDALRKKYDNLDAAYTALEQNSSKSIEENAQKNRELLAQLEAKEQALAAENDRLMRLEADMQERAQRIAELEALISAKDQAMTDLKNAISNALTAFEGKGLTIEQRDGKVYVSMENKLLFRSGSWAVGAEGKKAIRQLGNVLGENPDIAVLIEGHTDNVPFSSGGKWQTTGIYPPKEPQLSLRF